jgi:hypothetical protein
MVASVATVLVLTVLGACALSKARRCTAVFDFSCATTDELPASVAGHMKSSQLPILSGHTSGTLGHWSDRAIRVELIGDSHPELLVPTECGATGNCSWLIYTDGPPRLLGSIVGALICVDRQNAGPARLSAYQTSGAGQGAVAIQVYQNGRYELKSFKDLQGSKNDSFLSDVGAPSCDGKG